MTIKRGYVYWDVFTAKTGLQKRVPVLVVSNDASNENSEYVNTVRLALSASQPHPSHLTVPKDAWLMSQGIGNCIIRCETVSVTKAADLYGPVAQILPEWMERVEQFIKAHLGMAKIAPNLGYEDMRGTYTAPHSPQARQTFSQEPVTPRPIIRMYGQPETEGKQ